MFIIQIKLLGRPFCNPLIHLFTNAFIFSIVWLESRDAQSIILFNKKISLAIVSLIVILLIIETSFKNLKLAAEPDRNE